MKVNAKKWGLWITTRSDYLPQNAYNFLLKIYYARGGQATTFFYGIVF